MLVGEIVQGLQVDWILQLLWESVTVPFSCREKTQATWSTSDHTPSGMEWWFVGLTGSVLAAWPVEEVCFLPPSCPFRVWSLITVDLDMEFSFIPLSSFGVRGLCLISSLAFLTLVWCRRQLPLLSLREWLDPNRRFQGSFACLSASFYSFNPSCLLFAARCLISEFQFCSLAASSLRVRLPAEF